ncbi:MAG: hypothetical protein RLZZ09_1058 [Pseudomonadota bacterium]|jgi:hypothetical protein
MDVMAESRPKVALFYAGYFASSTLRAIGRNPEGLHHPRGANV